MVDLSALSYSLRFRFAGSVKAVSLGHCQQLLAAAFGFKSLASFQALGHADDFSDLKAIILDSEGLEQRALSLGLELPNVVQDVQRVLERSLPETNVFTGLNGFGDWVDEFMVKRIESDDDVISEMSMTNGWLRETYMSAAILEHLDLEADDDYSENVIGSVTMEQDPEKVDYGTRIRVDGDLFIGRASRRLISNISFDVQKAALAWFGQSDDEPDDDFRRGTMPLALLLSDMLGLSEAEAEDVEFEVSDDEGHGGTVGGLIVDFRGTPEGAVADKIRGRFPSMRTTVPLGHFETVRRDLWGEMY